MELTPQDFESLSDTQMQWKGYDWEEQAGRFTSPPNFEFKWAYWFDSYAALLFARLFLSEREAAFQHFFDEGTEQYVLITDYALEYVGV